MVNPNGHGGSRKNSGRKRWNHRVDADQPSIMAAFGSSRASGATQLPTERERQAQVIPAQNTITRGRSPTRRTTSSTSRSTSLPTQRNSSSAAVSEQNSSSNASTTSRNIRSRSTPRSSSSSSQNTTFSIGTSFTNLPNNDVDTNVDETEFHRGKNINGSKNLQLQQKRLLQDSYRIEAFQKIQREGIFWDHPPSMVVKAIPDLKECWMEFFKLPVFNWIPEAILGTAWKPHCPNCKKKLNRNGVKMKARLIFGKKQNYWLNAPQRYICQSCCDASKEAEKKGEPKITHNFYDTSQCVLDELERNHPELMNVFPCHLTNKNGIDKELMELIIHGAVKGIGPAAMLEIIASLHELEWQKGENQWLRYLLGRLSQPTANQQPIARNDIDKCPHYFTKKMGGCVPSAGWLIEMFCIIIKRRRPVYDSECIKRAISSLLLAMDTSYKVPKWMMTHGKNERVYNALVSATNEYNEIPMQILATSDNHEEIGRNLEALKRLGLNPFLAFTDNPGRDEALLKRIFTNLSNIGDGEGEVEDMPDDLLELTSEKDIIYLHEINRACVALTKFRHDIEEALKNQANSKVLIAFDTEWPVYLNNGQLKGSTQGDVNIVTIGSNAVNYTIILELYNFTGNPHHLERIGTKLRAIFMLPVAAITGCRQKQDYNKLQDQYKKFDLPDTPKKLMEDVSLMALNRGLVKKGRGTSTLQALCRGQKRYLKKPVHVRVGEVFASTNGSLSLEARKYCQMDVESTLLLHSIYSGIPDRTLRATTANLPIGTVVDIMPGHESAVDPIAQGVVRQVGGSVWAQNKMKIRKDRVLVEVTEVYDGKGLIHYPSTDSDTRKCACKRLTHGKIGETCDFYLFSQLGPPPFNIMELKSRLRIKRDEYPYPPSIYSSESETTPTPTPTPLVVFETKNDDLLDPKEVDESGDAELGGLVDIDDDDDASIEEDSVDGDDMPGITPEAAEIIKGVADGEDIDVGLVEDVEEDQELSEKQIRMALNEDFTERLEKLIEEADKAAGGLLDHDDEDNIPLEELGSKAKYKSVLGDAFHFMDRAKLPMHHEYKALFFRALRAAMFILNKEDVAKVKKVLENKPGMTWEKALTFNFDYIAARVRRTVPPASILYNRMLAVFDFFKDRKDSDTGHVLFHETNRKKFRSVLEMVKKGYASDPPGLSLYVPKTDRYGRNMVDRDGLQLYRSLRGTSNLESLHQYLTTSFGHTMAGPWYCDSLLAVIRHFYNWRMSRKNRPHFPPLMHYDSALIDRVNNLYESVFGHRKYRHWEDFNANLPVEPAYGIVPVNPKYSASLTYTESDLEQIKKNKTLLYLADKQQSPFPFLPVRGENEKKLVHKKLNDIVASEASMSSQRVYEKIATDWNTHHVDIEKKTYPKLPQHFSKYFKAWEKNQSKRDAELASGSNRLMDVLNYIPETRNETTVQLSEISNPATQVTETETPIACATETETPIARATETETPIAHATETETSNISTENTPAIQQDPTENTIVERTNTLELLAACVVCNDGEEEQQPKKKKRKKYKKKTCQGYEGKPCTDPENCPGMSVKKNCLVRTKGDPSLKVKRTINKPYTRTCIRCKTQGCPGSQNRNECMYS